VDAQRFGGGGVIIRPLTPADLPPIVGCIASAWLTDRRRGSSMSRPRTRRGRMTDVETMLARGDGWGAFEGERLVGKLTIDALPYPSLAHTFWIHAVYVHPDARGTGASGKLIKRRSSTRRQRRAPHRALGQRREHPCARAL
jgi:GNAT superfamily N-acetyltransferase